MYNPESLYPHIRMCLSTIEFGQPYGPDTPTCDRLYVEASERLDAAHDTRTVDNHLALVGALTLLADELHGFPGHNLATTILSQAQTLTHTVMRQAVAA